MSFLRRKPAEQTATITPEPEPASPPTGKGRPTPKRRDAEGRRGPVPPPPMTQREAVKRAKSQGKSMTKEERRAAATERRQRMASGDYVLPRDRGPVRAYVRDLVDARRHVAGILLPIALLSFIVLILPNALVQAYGPLILLIAITAALIDSFIFGRQMMKKVRRKFPNGDDSGLSTKGSALGFYAFNRACLIRKWRVPRPKVTTGERID